jgi:acyl-CoA dehydrogenase
MQAEAIVEEQETVPGLDDLEAFRDSVRRFVERELEPAQAQWREQGAPDAAAWTSAGAAGLLLVDVPEAYGGGGGNFLHQALVQEELVRAGVNFGTSVQDIVAHYILAYASKAKKREWLPRMAKGELVGAIAMTEPEAGSDLQGVRMSARRDGDHYVVSGSKTFVTNGALAGLVVLVVKTAPEARGPKGMSLLVAETAGLEGFQAGRPLEKIGQQAQDCCELYFDKARIPVANLLGAEGQGLSQLMEQLRYERLGVGVRAVAAAERAVALTARYVKDRKVGGRPLMELQNTRFRLAECATEARIGRVFLDDCIRRQLAGTLDDATAAMAKCWLTEMQGRVADACLQMHGGYGYMAEFPIARLWTDARVQRIYAGSNEIMKEVIAWSL